MDMGGKVVQGQKRRHFLHVKRLGIQPDAEIFWKYASSVTARYRKSEPISCMGLERMSRLTSSICGRFAPWRRMCQRRFFPCFILVKNMLHQIEDPEDVRIRLDHDHAAPVIERRQVPMLPEADEAHIFAQRRARGQMVGRADVDAVFSNVCVRSR